MKGTEKWDKYIYVCLPYYKYISASSAKYFSWELSLQIEDIWTTQFRKACLISCYWKLQHFSFSFHLKFLCMFHAGCSPTGHVSISLHTIKLDLFSVYSVHPIMVCNLIQGRILAWGEGFWGMIRHTEEGRWMWRGKGGNEGGRRNVRWQPLGNGIGRNYDGQWSAAQEQMSGELAPAEKWAADSW